MSACVCVGGCLCVFVCLCMWRLRFGWSSWGVPILYCSRPSVTPPVDVRACVHIYIYNNTPRDVEAEKTEGLAAERDAREMAQRVAAAQRAEKEVRFCVCGCVWSACLCSSACMSA